MRVPPLGTIVIQNSSNRNETADQLLDSRSESELCETSQSQPQAPFWKLQSQPPVTQTWIFVPMSSSPSFGCSVRSGRVIFRWQALLFSWYRRYSCDYRLRRYSCQPKKLQSLSGRTILKMSERFYMYTRNRQKIWPITTQKIHNKNKISITHMHCYWRGNAHAGTICHQNRELQHSLSNSHDDCPALLKMTHQQKTRKTTIEKNNNLTYVPSHCLEAY